MTRSLVRRLTHIALALGVVCTSAAASPPLTSLAYFDAEDVQLWSQPLWLASADREAVTAPEPVADDLTPQEHVDQGPPAPEPVLKPYAPGDSVSIGKANRGYLADGVQLDANDHMLTRPKRNWGTQEAVNAIRTAAAAVNVKFPEDTQKLVVGDLSLPGGGRFPPHKSHQSGRDADIGYYVKTTTPTRLMRVNANTMDLPRTWTFLESLLADGKVKFLFIDYRLQRALYKHARDVESVPEAQLAKWFSYPKARVVRGIPIRHLRGHADHMHVRFFTPQAVANFTGYVDYHGADVLKPVPVHYRVRKGDSLYRISRKFRLKIKQLRKMNRMRRKRTRLRPGQKMVVGWRRPTLPGVTKSKKALANKRR
ncbi:MAG: hypothetical protein ACI9U2_001025 [Bradymonadia bacterium]|jgi:hypothetical protein